MACLSLLTNLQKLQLQNCMLSSAAVLAPLAASLTSPEHVVL